MMRPAWFVFAPMFVFAASALAQAPAPSPNTAPSPATQLDRIEHKLDELLQRLDAPHAQPSATAQGSAASLGVIPSPAPITTPASPPEAYKPGALAIMRAAPRDPNSLPTIPADSVGGFVYAGGLIRFTEIATHGVRYVGPVGAEIQGWLRAREAGRYEIATDLSASLTTNANSPPTCFLQAWIEDRSLGQKTLFVTPKSGLEADATLVLGAELQPGLYRLRVWTVCTEPPGITTTSDLLLKAPSELNLRPATGNDLLHREG
jgi:hypothetical protein